MVAIKRLKKTRNRDIWSAWKYWDEIHQGLGFLTKRHLREQATRIEKKKKRTHGNQIFSNAKKNSQIEINNVITNEDTTKDTVIETIVTNDLKNVERNNDPIDILRSSDQYHQLQYI